MTSMVVCVLMQLLVKYSSWADAFCLSVPIVLGTTGLRRQTINTYLSMLGYCQTPRGSPANGRRNSNGQIAPGTPLQIIIIIINIIIIIIINIIIIIIIIIMIMI